MVCMRPEQTGMPPEQVFKTLVGARGAKWPSGILHPGLL